jgi:hypothetical protein
LSLVNMGTVRRPEDCCLRPKGEASTSRFGAARLLLFRATRTRWLAWVIVWVALWLSTQRHDVVADVGSASDCQQPAVGVVGSANGLDDVRDDEGD